jgi:hypothetical protein
MAADALIKGSKDELTAGLRGNLPGVHNMVTEDRRDRSSNFGKANNSAKLDQRALAEVQPAVLAFDKAVLDKGLLPEEEAARLRTSIQVRERALQLKLLDGTLMNAERARDLTPEQKSFYANLRPEEAAALVEVQQRVSQNFWERHLDEARFVTEERKATDEHMLRDDNGLPKTLSQLLDENPGKAVKLSDDLILRRNDTGTIVIEDRFNGTTVTSPGYLKAIDAMARLPRITDIKLPNGESSLAQRLVETKLLDPTTRQGLAHTRTLRAAAAQEMFASDVPVNRGEWGKALRQNHGFLSRAGLARGVARTDLARIEGIELDGHLRAAALVKDQRLKDVIDQFKYAVTTDKKTRNGSVRSVPAAQYSGPLRGRTDTVKKGGFRVRAEKTTTPESAVVRTMDPKAFNAGPTKDMVREMDRRLGEGLGTMVYDANRLVRYGAHPEIVGEKSHVASSRLQDAFRKRSVFPAHKPTVVNSREIIPPTWDDADGDYLDRVFVPGSRVDTNGYVLGAVNKSAADAATRGERARRQYKVQYLSTDHISQDSGSAVIGKGVGFRVHSVDRTGDLPVVRLVQDDLAADMANGKASL